MVYNNDDMMMNYCDGDEGLKNDGMNAEELLEVLDELDSEDEYLVKVSRTGRNRRNRQRKKSLKLKKLLRETKEKWAGPVFEDEKGYTRRVYCAENSKRYYKKHSNKLVRRVNNKMLSSLGAELPQGNRYRRRFDYDWEIN